ncbi:MAG TPA: polyprenyl synthetase family protein [Thermoanaerobaculia bacterium]|nr:polyprenyl synthetase family protein [Thermoanaerobaculia bacterium]
MSARPSALVTETLEEYGGMTRALLPVYLPAAEPAKWLWEPVADYPNRGGKMLRPALCIAAARAFGGAAEEAARTAVALELLHNALLVHDDIQDGSELRRGQPTLHRLHGVPIAINAGDMLALLAIRPLVDNRAALGGDLALQLLEEAQWTARESAEGQAMELGWRRDHVFDLDSTDYLLMVLKKTCWLTTLCPLRSGALIGARGRFDPDRLLRFGFFLGAAFQIQDDLLNLLGDAECYGKERDGDLWEGKRTLMLIHLLERAEGGHRERLRALLRRPREERDAEDVAWLRTEMERHGAIEAAREVAHGLAGAALHELESIFPAGPSTRDRRFLRELVVWMLERELPK